MPKASGYDSNAPYTVALVKLDEGPMVNAQLTDVDNSAIQIGMRVEMVTRKMRGVRSCTDVNSAPQQQRRHYFRTSFRPVSL